MLHDQLWTPSDGTLTTRVHLSSSFFVNEQQSKRGVLSARRERMLHDQLCVIMLMNPGPYWPLYLWGWRVGGINEPPDEPPLAWGGADSSLVARLVRT
jgi:hypothetical protein